MKIIDFYWGDVKKGEESERMAKEMLDKNIIKNVFIGLKKIPSFEMETKNGEFRCYYSLRKGCKHKYYVSLSNHDMAYNDETVVFLEDVNYGENKEINDATKRLLNC